MARRRPSVFLDTETTGLYPGKAEMLSISMLGENGEPLLRDPKTGEPVHEAKFKPKNLESASPYALDVNGYPAWQRFMDQDVEGPDGSIRRGDLYDGWKKDKTKLKALEDQWREFHLNPSDEEAEARKTDDWSDAVPFDEMRDQIADIIKERRVVGQNPFFDQRFIEFELDRAGSDQKIGDDIIDTQVLSWLAGMQHQSLGNTTEQLDITLENAHTAYADTEATRQVFQVLSDPEKLGEIRRNQDPEQGRTRNVLFVGLTTSGDNPRKDEVTGLAVVDPQGRTLMDAKLDSDEAKSDAIRTFTGLMRDHAMGTTDPDRDAAFIGALAKSHGRKHPETGRPIDGWQGGRRFFHTPSLTQVFDAEPQGEAKTALEKARQQHGMFNEVAEKAYGPGGEQRRQIEQFEQWIGGRTFRHPLPKGHPKRRKDYLTFKGIQQLTRSDDHGVARAGKQALKTLWRQFQQAQAQAQRHKQARRVASRWMRGFLRAASR